MPRNEIRSPSIEVPEVTLAICRILRSSLVADGEPPA